MMAGTAAFVSLSSLDELPPGSLWVGGSNPSFGILVVGLSVLFARTGGGSERQRGEADRPPGLMARPRGAL
ncbi:hypothetical protein VQ042_25400, partial [Aurantimonas sp. A2-1-M11]|uniref:hypothetical protein n=1 Tax=Aurantimonas sp. A2-1-M11 TaxID=3113712 RepID=UPI002F935875